MFIRVFNLLTFLIFFIFTPVSHATAEKTQSFEKTLNGVQTILYSVPIKAKALLTKLEKVELKQNQPLPLLVRYYLQKSTVELLLNNPDSAIESATQGIELAKGDPLLNADRYLMQLRLSQARILKGEEALVLDQLDNLLSESQALNDPAVTAEILLVKGQAYKAQNEYDISMAALMSSLEAAKATEDKILIERIASNLGGILVQLNGFDKASLLLEQSYQFFQTRKMSFNQLLVKLDMAELARKQGNNKQALLEYKQALQIAQVLGDGSHRFRINLQIADLLLQSGDTKNMMRYLKSTDNLRERETIRFYISKYNHLKANESLINGDYPATIEIITPLIAELSQLQRLYRSELALYLVASKAYFGLEDYKNAYLTLLDYQNRFNTFSADEQVDNLERQQMLFNLEKLKAENQHLSWNNVLQTLELKTNEQKVEYLNLLVVLGIAATVIASLIALWINRRRIRWGKIANTDSLTGLHNRRYLAGQLERLQKEMATSNLPVGCLLLDIDYFKTVNDTYGHPVGDKVLMGISELFKNNLRRDDICSRVGGEEFMLLLPNSGIEETNIIAEDLRQRISNEVFTSEKGDTFAVTASFGSISANPTQSLSELYSIVDKLLYRAKQNGRNRVETFSASDDTNTSQSASHEPMSINARFSRRVRRLKFRVAQHFS
ncbi:GGDEF domain-containing protein [Enterovibrio nigricans]|uniref:diguanylate cyclase n=1 Tax=Enterovibrio nigricans DSM 22720 TaxID=1121868 RepID=A0A1T4V0Q1_9GAMM|nr:GGDEF domain-containing protein [Enterovibrio nigricans]SKA58505.1 diguanylate cyclase (GGDEF) domain-containing protein [Enterovibrio nigricans DSM 22720]